MSDSKPRTIEEFWVTFAQAYKEEGGELAHLERVRRVFYSGAIAGVWVLVKAMVEAGGGDPALFVRHADTTRRVLLAVMEAMSQVEEASSTVLLDTVDPVDEDAPVH